MFDITLYVFSKKINSTRMPSGGETLSCLAKDLFDIINPILIINHVNPTSYNYAKINIFNRYYFIDKWEYDKNVWIAHLSVDVLSSFKTQIGGNTEYILRSSNSYNMDIVDNLYPLESNTEVVRETLDSPWNVNNGMYIVGILGSGLSNYYLMSENNFLEMIQYLFSDDYLDSIYPFWHELVPDLKVKTNPLQFITVAKWIPFRVTLTSPIVTEVTVGYGNVPCIAQVIPSGQISVIEKSFTLKKHPQSSRGTYLNKSPYTTYTLFYPPYGLIELDSNLLGDVTTLKTTVEADLRTGKSTLTLSIDDDFNRFKVITWLHSEVYVDVQLSQIGHLGTSPLSFVKPLAQLFTGNIGGAALTTLGSIGDATRSMTPSASSIGSDGSISSYGSDITMLYSFKKIADENISNFGRPLCERRKISELGGYMLVQQPIPVVDGATYQELETIKNYMEGGFYYE